MIKIRKIVFWEHPVLGNLALDFCGRDGKAADAILIAGENGSGKSTIINTVSEILNDTLYKISRIEWENEGVCHFVDIQHTKENTYCTDDTGRRYHGVISLSQYNENKPINVIFSDVDINFKAKAVESVTSKNLDASKGYVRSNFNFPTEIKQLLVDIQALDNDAIAREVEANPNTAYKDLAIEKRMTRFTNAFNKMFDDLKYCRVSNAHGHKEVLFKKYGKEITIDQLSSGEKQIVYRGCFLLKDKESMNGAIVFIDEPEISLHPIWQKKIMDYYKGIFTNVEGIQTSQIFAVTHSPFVIHNENRKNDKVIVLKRDADGKIVVEENPEYYDCSSTKVVEDAFSISDFSEHQYDSTQSCVYLEGRTDEKYFNKALEVFGYKDVPFQFKWIGYIDDKGDERFTGYKALDQACDFLISSKPSVKSVLLYDCDTKKPSTEKNNVYTRAIPSYHNSKGMKKGIENALILDSVDTSNYYSHKEIVGDYGEKKDIPEFQKMDFCNHVCSLDGDELKIVLSNLKAIIDDLLEIFKQGALG